jgi:hypothetical protein
VLDSAACFADGNFVGEYGRWVSAVCLADCDLTEEDDTDIAGRMLGRRGLDEREADGLGWTGVKRLESTISLLDQDLWDTQVKLDLEWKALLGWRRGITTDFSLETSKF